MSATDDRANVTCSSNACIVCYRDAEYYSIGMCEHPVCYECSTRMRVLCQQNECPICRRDLPKVVFTKEIKPFRFLKKGNLVDTRYNIHFESEDVQAKFVELLTHRCNVCKDEQIFSTFNSLKEHMKRKHDLHYCEHCVENLKIFSFERRCYTRQELSRHYRKGDLDDKSHKGHPLCEFCDKRYMDNDELYRHLRRDHLFCHICDADGFHHYYNSYEYLREHFRHEHHLCEEGGCADEQFTSVFRTDIDLKAHKASVHGKELGKAAARQARTLELEFSLAPRGDLRNRRPGPMRQHDGNANFSRNHQQEQQLVSLPEDELIFVPPRQPDVQSTEEFPTLGNTAPSCPMSMPKPRNVTIQSTLRQGNYNENFPALGPDSSGGSTSGPGTQKKTLNFSVTSSSCQPTITSVRRPVGSPNLSIHVNHRPNGTVTTRVAGPNLRITPGSSRDLNFPALGRADPPPQSSWTKVTVKPAVTPRREKVAPPPFPPAAPPVQSDEAFPSLTKTTKTKGVTPAITTSWVQVSSTSTGTSNTTPSMADATKGKAKKKKKQQQTSTSNGTTSSTESSSSAKAKKESTDNKKSSAKISKESEPSKKDRSKTKPNSDKSKKEEPIASVQATAAPRKRTELKIESLNNNVSLNNNNITSVKAKTATPEPEDFPALGRRPPPGLTNPPPGFSSSPPIATNASAPPPGFEGRPNGLTFTTSSGENYAIVPEAKRRYEYLPPADFQQRNQKLIAEFDNCFGAGESEELKVFRYLSGLFRTGGCDADEYYEQCRVLMGVEAFNRIFPELLALLPDLDKQRELFNVHKLKSLGRTNNLDSCATCGQVLRSSDLPSHVASHNLENHFPALGKSSSVGSGGWSRK